jgi:hypothetical protein
MTEGEQKIKDYIGNRITNLKPNSFFEDKHFFDHIKSGDIEETEDYIFYTYENNGGMEIPSMGIIVFQGHETTLVYHTASKTYKEWNTR